MTDYQISSPVMQYKTIYYIHTMIYAPKSIKIKIVSSHQRSQLIGHTIFFTSEKRHIDAPIGYIIIFTSEQNRIARSPLLLTDKQHISKSLVAFFFRKMASNQTNCFQSLDSSVGEFIDGQENENTKKKTRHDVALFHEFLVLKGETRQMDELTLQELNDVSGFRFCISNFELPWNYLDIFSGCLILFFLVLPFYTTCE